MISYHSMALTVVCKSQISFTCLAPCYASSIVLHVIVTMNAFSQGLATRAHATTHGYSSSHRNVCVKHMLWQFCMKLSTSDMRNFLVKAHGC